MGAHVVGSVGAAWGYDIGGVLSACVDIVQDDLKQWYTKYHAEGPSETLTRIQTLTRPMVGTDTTRKLKLKAAEGKMFFHFLVDKVSAHCDLLRRGDLWVAAGQSMVRFIQILEEQPLVLSPAAYQELLHAHTFAPLCCACACGGV